MNSHRDNSFRLLTSPLRMLPSFVIPGETKCGTTTYYDCLVRHPLIAPASIKEPNNFIRYGGTAAFCRMHYPFVWNRWLSGGQLITGEASVEYLSKAHVPAAMAELLPNVKMIFMFRNPIERALSDFKMMRETGQETEPFPVVMRHVLGWLKDNSLERLVRVARHQDAPPLRYLTKGCYARSLQPWLKVYPRENMLFIKSEDFFQDPQATLDVGFRFLGLEPVKVEAVPNLRKARDGSGMDANIARELSDFYRPSNEDLYKIVGRNYGW